MRSASPATDEVTPEVTARARILDAAIRCFADAGVAGTSVRAIAAAAEVSAGLVIHHFGSKDGLRVACDQRVAALVRPQKREAVSAGAGLDPVAALRTYGEGPPLLAYLARTLVDGSPHVVELVEEMVTDAVEYTEEAVAAGLLHPTDDPYGRAAVLTLWSLGALVLNEHAKRLLGVDLADLGTDPETVTRYFAPALEVLGRGVLTEEAFARMSAALRDRDEEVAP
jgi:AcrR family transcriptional regulator